MIQKTVEFDVSHPDPHAYRVAGFRLKMAETVASGPYLNMVPDITFDRNVVPVGQPLSNLRISTVLDVPYNPVDYYFIVVALDDDGDESGPSDPPLIVSFNETFAPPGLSYI